MTTGRIDESQTTPTVWVDLLDEHDHDLTRVRLLWRRGGGRYRPMVRPDVDVAALEDASMSDWEAQELPEARPAWVVETHESPEERHRRLKAIADHFWRLAVEWTRYHGPICDLQLRGYAEGDAILFEAGKRCNLVREQQPVDPAPAPMPKAEGVHAREIEREREFAAAREARMSADVHLIHRTYADLLGSLKRERDDAIKVAQDSARMAPNLFGAATDMLKDSIDFQRDHVRQLIENATGTREFEVRAFAEREQSVRNRQTLDFLWNAFSAGVGALGPLVSQVVETVTNRPVHGIPDFQIAQQAIGYLELSLTQGQLRMLFPRQGAAEEFLEIMADAASRADETEAILALKGMEGMFRAATWAQVATPEQMITGRFIIGRAALLRVRATAAGAG